MVISDNETGRKENGKAGHSHEEAAEKVLGKIICKTFSKEESTQTKEKDKDKKIYYILKLGI